MASSIPAKLKDADITQFALRANQLEKFKPIITYWLRFYITQKIIAKNLHLADPECTTYTTDLMEKLEQTKAEHSTEDALSDELAAYAYCEQFALETFARADNAMRSNNVTAQTVDTLRAAATFFEMLTIWKNPLEPEIASKLKFAKFHAVRIVKALKAGENPNLTNPVQESPPTAASPPALDPSDPEVRRVNEGAPPSQLQNPYQPYVESAPNTSAQPSPNFSPSRVSPPPDLPAAPTGYGARQSPPPAQFGSHRDVSPISQPETSRHGSVASVGGGYFPRVDIPTFTADNAPPSLPTASEADEHMTSPFDSASLPQAPQAPQAPDPQSFYQSQTSPPPTQHPQHPQNPYLPPQNAFQHQQPHFTSSPSPQPPPQHQPQAFQPSPVPQQQNYQYSQQASQPTQQYTQPMTGISQQHFQGPFRTDEDSVMEAQKRAKWAISALNFEDVPTAVKELRSALRALGAN